MTSEKNLRTQAYGAHQVRRKIGFIGAACALAVAYASSSAPIPLYATYRKSIGLTNANLSMTAVAYFVGTVIALILFARLSNHLGRRPVVLATLCLSAVGCGIFYFLHSAPIFLLGRLVQGLSCGLASSCIAAYVVDTAPEKPSWIGTTVTSSAPMVGLAAGSFGSGALVQYGSGSLSRVFGILIAVIAVCAVLVVAGAETTSYKKGALVSIKPQVRVPKHIRKLLPAASAVFAGTWAVGGFYQAFSAPMAAEQFHTKNVMVAAAIFACMMAPNVIGSTVASRFQTRTAQRGGMLLFTLSVVVIIASLGMGNVVLFLLASVCAGIGCGLAFTSSMRGILDETVAQNRAGVLSTIYLISYGGAAIPNLVVGRISGRFNLLQIAAGYGVLVVLACIITFLTSSKENESEVVSGGR